MYSLFLATVIQRKQGQGNMIRKFYYIIRKTSAVKNLAHKYLKVEDRVVNF